MKIKMWCRLAVILTFFGCLSAEHLIQNFGPCNFFETINITSGHLDQYGNFHHDDVVYRRGTFQEYDYILRNFSIHVKVPVHVRGCVCLYKTCIRLCNKCDNELTENCVRSSRLIMPTEDDEEEIDLDDNKFGVLVGKPCNRMYELEPAQYPDDQWTFSVSLNFI